MNHPNETEKHQRLEINKNTIANLDDEQAEALEGGAPGVVDSCINQCQSTYLHMDIQVVISEETCSGPIIKHIS